MVWGAFDISGTLPLAFVSTKMNSEQYQETLQEHLIPYWLTNYAFQQDNAAIHTSASTKKFFLDNAITLLDWPACSPDLNPIENLWGIIVRDIYRHNKQYETVRDLKIAILKTWQSIKKDCLETLVKSVPSRLIEVIKAGGGPTHY